MSLGSPKKDARGGVSEDNLNVLLILSQNWRRWATILFSLRILWWEFKLDHNRPCIKCGEIEFDSKFSHGMFELGANHWAICVSLVAIKYCQIFGIPSPPLFWGLNMRG